MEERFDYDGLLEVNSDLRKQLADAQATVEALQAQLEAAERHNTILQDANKVALEKVEALQRERDAIKRSVGLDCGDQSCLYALEHSGMRTNGGCRCSPKRMKEDLQRAQAALTPAGGGQDE